MCPQVTFYMNDVWNVHYRSKVWSVVFFFKEINNFVEQGLIKELTAEITLTSQENFFF